MHDYDLDVACICDCHYHLMDFIFDLFVTSGSSLGETVRLSKFHKCDLLFSDQHEPIHLEWHGPAGENLLFEVDSGGLLG